MEWLIIAGYLFIAFFAIAACWFLVRDWFGNMAATFSTIILITVLLVLANKWIGQPTEQELKHFETQRRDKGR